MSFAQDRHKSSVFPLTPFFFFLFITCNTLYTDDQHKLDDTYGFDYGLHYDWSRIRYNIGITRYEASNWLHENLENTEKTANNHIPVRDDGSPYDVDMCQPDQKDVIAYCINIVCDFIESPESGKWNPTKRLIVTGGAGSGKSTTINTLVSLLSSTFGYNSSVHVFAPTGLAAFNTG